MTEDCDKQHRAIEKWIKAELKAVDKSIEAAKEAIGAKAAQAMATKATVALGISIVSLIITMAAFIFILSKR